MKISFSDIPPSKFELDEFVARVKKRGAIVVACMLAWLVAISIFSALVNPSVGLVGLSLVAISVLSYYRKTFFYNYVYPSAYFIEFCSYIFGPWAMEDVQSELRSDKLLEIIEIANSTSNSELTRYVNSVLQDGRALRLFEYKVIKAVSDGIDF